ncbi:beta-galactosidase GalA [Rhizosphaericola mali]|uniref:Glycoside hydrolase family 2 protein n=1 Tax=Rhizosphaericola mali TaxID=2545455 RepID=A0A5P2G7E3_9BACT|nr:beta-galactosidase GalA [Rhizosphaericola mali]QES89133.1 glycoside hydrolase family 2 protein [Rhizosphaericola mali]
MYHKYLLALLISGTIFTQTSNAQTERKHINFDFGWKFHLGNASDPNRDFNYGIGNVFSKSGETSNTAISEKWDESGWDSVNLPHDWVVGLPFTYIKNDDIDAHGYKPVGGLFPENSIGWYRKSFTLNAQDSGGRYILQFDGVYRDSKVWINGYYVGGNFSGYTTAYYDITDFIRFGKKNTLVVRADATQDEGWFYEGAGIYRHVWLNNYNDVHIAQKDGFYVHTAIKGKDATIYTETKVENKSLENQNISVFTEITNREGKVIGTSKVQPIQLAIDESGRIKQSIALKNVELWDLDNPYLYRAVTVVTKNGKELDRLKVKFGIREFKFDSKDGFFLNGKSVKMLGVSNHQDHAGVGVALPDYLQYYRVGLLKEMGANAYRTTHNPPTPELLDACDSLGILVFDETRLLTSGNEYAKQLTDLVERDRNHASVFMWSIGNEEYLTQANNIGTRIAQNQINLIKTLDTTRGISYAANMGNVYKGVNEVIPIRGFNYHLEGIDPYHKDHPEQPVYGSEVSSMVSTRGVFIKDTVNCYVPDYDSTFPSWAAKAETWWTQADARKWYMGGFVWTGFDYRGEPTPYRWPNINSHFGIMDMCGFPKTVYYYYQAWWSNKDVLNIAPHWNWKGDEGKEKLVWINSNAEDVELFLNGQSLGKKTMPKDGHLTWNVKYTPGELKAIGHRNGKEITSIVKTTDVPYQIKLSPSKKVLLADGEDAVVVNVSVVDKEGLEVPNANDLIQFSLNGTDAQIIGVGNGDPSSHEADKCVDGAWQRHLFGGKAQVIIKSGKNKGQIQMVASSNIIKNAIVEFDVN